MGEERLEVHLHRFDGLQHEEPERLIEPIKVYRSIKEGSGLKIVKAHRPVGVWADEVAPRRIQSKHPRWVPKPTQAVVPQTSQVALCPRWASDLHAPLPKQGNHIRIAKEGFRWDQPGQVPCPKNKKA